MRIEVRTLSPFLLLCAASLVVAFTSFWVVACVLVGVRSAHVAHPFRLLCVSLAVPLCEVELSKPCRAQWNERRAVHASDLRKSPFGRSAVALFFFANFSSLQ